MHRPPPVVVLRAVFQVWVTKVATMSRQMFAVVDSGQARAVFDKLHEDVARHHGRVVITRNGTDARCVLMSEVELHALERALEILSGTTDAAEMRAEVMRIAAGLAENRRAPFAWLS